MLHLETLIAEFLDWSGYLVKRNIKVGRLAHGGWEMELDIVAYQPQQRRLVHYEPSLDADSWSIREERNSEKFGAGGKYILGDVFPWLEKTTRIEQFAVFVSHPKGRDEIAGGKIISVDELTKEIKDRVCASGMMVRNAIPEQFPLLRTIQLGHCGYYKAL